MFISFGFWNLDVYVVSFCFIPSFDYPHHLTLIVCCFFFFISSVEHWIDDWTAAQEWFGVNQTSVLSGQLRMITTKQPLFLLASLENLHKFERDTDTQSRTQKNGAFNIAFACASRLINTRISFIYSSPKIIKSFDVLLLWFGNKNGINGF